MLLLDFHAIMLSWLSKVSNDVVETDKAIRDLNIASFHWYLVKKAILLALDAKESDVDKIVKLLNTFSTSQLISEVFFMFDYLSLYLIPIHIIVIK